MQSTKGAGHATPVGVTLGWSALHVRHHHQSLSEESAVGRRDGHRHGQSFTVEVLEEPGLPVEIGVAPGTETTDREAPADAHAPHVVGDSPSERFDASCVFTPLPECFPSYWRHFRGVPDIARATRLANRSDQDHDHRRTSRLLVATIRRTLVDEIIEWSAERKTAALQLRAVLARSPLCDYRRGLPYSES